MKLVPRLGAVYPAFPQFFKLLIVDNDRNGCTQEMRHATATARTEQTADWLIINGRATEIMMTGGISRVTLHPSVGD